MSFSVKVRIPSLGRLPLRVNRAIKTSASRSLIDADQTVGNDAGKNVNSEGAYLGRPWKRLAKFTQERRKRRYPSTYYGKHPSGSGPQHPIGIWTGRLRGLIGGAGDLNRANLTIRRRYQAGINPDKSSQQRVYLLHVGAGNQPPRPIFIMEQGGKMPKNALTSFVRRFHVAFPVEMGRP